VLVVVVGAGMIAVAVTIPVGLHQHLFSGRPERNGVRRPRLLLRRRRRGTTFIFTSSASISIST